MIFIARFMNSFLHQASFATGYWCYDRHRSVRLVVLVGLAIDQIAQSGLSSLSVIYYSAQLFSDYCVKFTVLDALDLGYTVSVITDGCRGVNIQPQDSAEAFMEMAAGGATLYTLDDWLETHR